MTTQEVFSDRYSTYVRDPEHHVLELRWSSATASMTEDEFRSGLERLAGFLEREPARNVLIDVTTFAFRPSPEFSPWRDKFIIPRYNAAGVKKFAFLVPSNAPHSVEGGNPPAVEPPGAFPTGYFTSRDAVLEWFAG